MKRIMFFLMTLVVLFSYCSGGSQSAWKIKSEGLLSKFAKDVSPDNVLQEYPRPQMVREEWMNLNGLWNYAILPRESPSVGMFQGKILVPFPVESALSGVQKAVTSAQKVWYQRTFSLPDNWQNKKILLHFGAVDWEAKVWVNDKEIGSHRGGYDEFTLDITKALKPVGLQKITISVWDPTETMEQPRGKQVSNPHGIWYTAVTGIWQTVWIEPVEKDRGYIESFKLTPDIDAGIISVFTHISNKNDNHKLIMFLKKDKKVVLKKIVKGLSSVLKVKNPHLWTPEDPFLYDVEIQLLYKNKIVDNIKSYVGMRKISIAKDAKGIMRMMLNNEFVFQLGPLDQGWWPDGLYTAPTDEALRYDIEVTKQLGFNMVRKHVKVEPERWYYWCDKLGLLVWQDMPSGGEYINPDDVDAVRTEESSSQYVTELLEILTQFRNHPSIIVWVPFNEGWGQFDTERISKLIEDTDTTRLVDPASGWADRQVGQIKDIHAYPGPDIPAPEENRAIVLGEFGGLGLPLMGHTWQALDNWGYRSYKNKEDLAEAYINLIRDLQGLIPRGLSAAVYTQITDVEVEVNGLMTYDRQIIKINPEDMMKINHGFLPPVFRVNSNIFLKSMRIELANELQKGKIYYSLDGSQPTRESLQYKYPIDITKTTTVKARTYWEDDSFSGVNQKTFIKVTLLRPIQKKVKSGIRYSYYDEGIKDFEKLPGFAKLSAKTKGVTDQINLEKAEKNKYFAMKFEGYIQVPTDGIYSFYTNSDDGTKLYIHDQLVVNNDYTHSMTEKVGQIALARGIHSILLIYFQGEGGKGLEVSYEGPGLRKRVIPAAAFYMDAK